MSGQYNDRVIMLADCQAFYASVEKAAQPEYRDRPLAVCGDPKRRSGIVLAACPIAKSYGVTTAERIGDALAKCPDLVVVKPRMQEYIDVSLQITSIYQSFTNLVEPYSIDEQFLDVTGSLRLFGSPEELALQMRNTVLSQTGVTVRIGISYCKVVAKMACDNFAKRDKRGIYSLPKAKLAEVLWPLPVQNMFMVGSRMTAHFAKMGIYNIGDIAQRELPDFKQQMRGYFGKQSDIQAELYWRIANGMDDSKVTLAAHDMQKSIGHQMTLPRDYRTAGEISVVLLELSELVCQRARAKGVMGWVVSVGCQGADYDRPTGFYRQMKLADPTHLAEEVFAAVMTLFQRHWNELPVRKVGVTLDELVDDETYQLVLFGDRERKMKLARSMDEIKLKYGNSAIVRAVSLTDAGQARDRSHKIGGHYK